MNELTQNVINTIEALEVELQGLRDELVKAEEKEQACWAEIRRLHECCRAYDKEEELPDPRD